MIYWVWWMVNVNVNFNVRDYLLACEEGQEESSKINRELGKNLIN